MARPANPLHVCLALAGALHLSASLALGHLRAPSPRATAAATPPPEVLVEELPAPDVEPAPVAGEAPRAAPAAAPTPSRSAAPAIGAVAAAVTTTEPDALPDVLTATGLPTPDGWTFQPSRATTNLFAGATASIAAGTEPPPALPGKATALSRSGGLIEGLDSSDRDKGLGHGGPVLSAVEDAAHTEEAPGEGLAAYEVVVRRAGGVRVALLSSTGDSAGWASLAPAIVRGVTARHVSIPEGAGGMRFVVEVEAEDRYPDGKRASALGNKTIATTGWGGRHEPGLSSPGVPMIGAVHTGKVCSAGAALAPGMVVVGGGCSVENIGAKPARVVSGRLVSESRVD